MQPRAILSDLKPSVYEQVKKKIASIAVRPIQLVASKLKLKGQAQLNVTRAQ